MSGKTAIWTFVIAALWLVASSAVAQEERNELTGMIGRTFISDQGIHGPNAPQINPFIRSGNGTSFEIDYSRRFFGGSIYSISAEVPAMFNLDEDLNSGSGVVPIDYKQIFVTPGFRANLFPATAVSPWIAVGGGFAHFSENSQLIYSAGPNPGKSTTSGVLEGGVGIDLNPFQHRFSHFGFRGEARDFWSGEPDFP
ncbi:MAG TPA: hypothetical protein VND65_00320, partial [Candidatus Binatia bacterium]|nr:hypothetical protein [Candidatus Binatia bacterium]